jgi:hypothetical protein
MQSPLLSSHSLLSSQHFPIPGYEDKGVSFFAHAVTMVFLALPQLSFYYAASLFLR